MSRMDTAETLLGTLTLELYFLFSDTKEVDGIGRPMHNFKKVSNIGD